MEPAQIIGIEPKRACGVYLACLAVHKPYPGPLHAASFHCCPAYVCKQLFACRAAHNGLVAPAQGRIPLRNSAGARLGKLAFAHINAHDGNFARFGTVGHHVYPQVVAFKKKIKTGWFAGFGRIDEWVEPLRCIAGFARNSVQQGFSDYIFLIRPEYGAVGFVDLNIPEIANGTGMQKNRFKQGQARVHVVKKALVAFFAHCQGIHMPRIGNAAPK